jgi:6-phosphofructokinase 2
MKSVITLTLNPAIDGSSDATKIHPTHKIRTTNQRYDPGGGGINVDTSGAALRETLKSGRIFLAKPSLGELESIVGRPLPDCAARADFARSLVLSGQAEHIAVTLGHLGAMLISAPETLHLPAIDVDVKSAVGAGDSFLGAMTYALAADQTMEDAFRLGVAAGTAAVLTPGTDLCHTADVERMLAKTGVITRSRSLSGHPS